MSIQALPVERACGAFSDPVLALARRWHAEAAKLPSVTDDRAELRALDAMADVETDLFNVRPTTAAGLLAKLRVYAEAADIHGDIARLLDAGDLTQADAATLRRLSVTLFGGRGA